MPAHSRENGKRGGRPPGRKNNVTLSKEETRERLREMLTAKLEPVAEALVSRAQGVRYFVTRNKTGKYELVTNPDQVIKALNQEDEFTGEFYTDKPETAAIKEFLDRTCDRSKEQEQEIKVTGEADMIAALIAGRKRAADARKA
jgi:hypothetical protein